MLTDGRVRGTTIEVGDHVLVRNVGVRERKKLANRWEEDDVYVLKEQPEIEMPVFVGQRQGASAGKRTLHRNMLLPVNFHYQWKNRICSKNAPRQSASTGTKEPGNTRIRDSRRAPGLWSQVIHAYVTVGEHRD